MSARTFMVTTPIYYLSGNPHIGHAYTSVAADVLGRYARTRGDAFVLTGTDEHGQKIEQAARKAGLSPQAWCDSVVPTWKRLCATYDVAYDDFIRTTEPRHTDAVLRAFERLRASGDVYLGTYEGWYCTSDETFWLEAKLIDGRCPNVDCRRAVEWISEENWFFALSKYRDRLLAYYAEHPHFVRPERARNEMLATLEAGLDDLCISRTNLDWGVALPGGGVMYVWLDALLNYITALGWESADPARMQTFWPANVHLVGKEIARFHAIVWPAVLMALDLAIPKCVFAHGWMTIEGEKMSKSRGNVVDPFALAERFGPDPVRYFLLREAPFGSDFSFGEEKVLQRYTSDLANDLGNLVRRSFAMLMKYRDGIVPVPRSFPVGVRFADLPSRVEAAIEALDFRSALDAIWALVSTLNRYIDETRPWTIAKAGNGSAADLDVVLYELCEGTRWLAHLLAPFIPRTAQAIAAQLGDTSVGAPWADVLTWGRLAGGSHVTPAEAPLFPRLEEPVREGVPG